MTKASIITMALAALGLAAASLPSLAQNYPTKSVTMVVALAAGAGPDVVARLYGDKLRARLGQTFVIDNRPGAAGQDTIDAVKRGGPDGYTLGVATSSIFAIRPPMLKNPNYNPETDFVPIAQYLKSPFVLIVNPALPVKNTQEFVDYVRKNPGKLTYATASVGGAGGLAAEIMKKRYGLDIDQVVYKNSPQGFLDVAAGHVPMSFADVGTSLPLIQAGKVRAIAVTSLTRLPVLPDVPTFAESTDIKDFEAVSWHILFANKGTDQKIIDKLHLEMKAIMADPEVVKKVADLGLLPHPVGSIDETRAYIKSELTKWGGMIKDLGLAGSL